MSWLQLGLIHQLTVQFRKANKTRHWPICCDQEKRLQIIVGVTTTVERLNQFRSGRSSPISTNLLSNSNTSPGVPSINIR